MEDGRVEVQVTIADSWELRWWLLGRGAQIEVLAPAELRAEMVDSIRAAAQRYGLS
jgi:predicted DNA-binding transcriptional regulator YafY